MTPWIFSFFVAVSFLATPAFAEDTASSNSSATEVEQHEARKVQAKLNVEKLREQQKTKREARLKALEVAKTAREEKKLETAKDLAQKLVDERADLLKKLASGEHLKRCRAAAKAEATSAINAAIARLGTIETTSPTTVEQVRTLIKETIIAKNRVYVGLLPAVRGMCAADGMIGVISDTATPAVNQLADQGLDVTNIQTEIDAAKTDAENAYAAYKKIATNPGTTTYKTDLAAAKALLKSAKDHLKTARTEIKTLKSATPTSSDSN